MKVEKVHKQTITNRLCDVGMAIYKNEEEKRNDHNLK